MLRRYCVTFGLFILLLATGQARQRTVAAEKVDKEVIRTAFRLGVAPERILLARPLLREATELGLKVADQKSLEGLVRSWTMIDRTQAEQRLVQILQELRKQTLATTQSEPHHRLSQNALATADALRQVNSALGDELLQGWPDAPPFTLSGSVEDALPSGADRNEMEVWMKREKRLLRQVRESMEFSLESIRKLEKGELAFEVRAVSITEFFQKGQLEDAHAVVDDTLRLLSEAPPSQQHFSGLLRVIQVYARFGDPERTDQLLRTWAGIFHAAREVDSPRFPSAGVEFYRDELKVMQGLGALSNLPELMLSALEYFPRLSKKVQAIGGIDAYFLAQRQPTDRAMTDPEEAKHSLEQEIRRRVLTAQRGRPMVPEQRQQYLEETAKLLFSLNDPVAEFDIYPNLITSFFRLEGELRPALRERGLAYIARFRKPGSFTEEELHRSLYLRRLDLLEETLYGMWIWSDPREALQAMEACPEEIRFGALASYLDNIGQDHSRGWRTH